MSDARSTTAKNLLSSFLSEAGSSLDDAHARTALPTERLAALLSDERLLPTPREIEALCLAYFRPVEALVAYDPLPHTVAALVAPLGVPLAGDKVQVTVVGLGNLGHVFLGLLSQHPELVVNGLAVRPDRAEAFGRAVKAQGGVRVVRRDGEVLGKPHRVSADPVEVIPGSHLVLFCLPSHVEPEVLARVAPHLPDGALLGSIPGPGGFHWAATRALEAAGKRAVVFGLASIPWMCKSDELGRVRVLGQKTITGLAALPRERASLAAEVMSSLLGLPVVDIQNFLQIILNPANQLLHPAITRDLFEGWDGRPLDEAPLFYESISERAAETLERMSDEILELKAALLEGRPDLSLSAVLPIDIAIRAAYGGDIADASSTRSIIATNRAYAGIRMPMVPLEGGLAPAFSSRFFTEDIPYGLVVLRGIADLVGVKMPATDEVLRWCQEKMGREYLRGGALSGADVADSGAPSRYGITTLDGLVGQAG